MLDPNEKEFMRALEELETKRKYIKGKLNASSQQANKSTLQKVLNLIILPFLIFFRVVSLVLGRAFSRKKKPN